MTSQLSLFDMETVVGSFYKPGDWVKIRKVPAIAKHVKCGQVYQITETGDGQLEFWNPFIADWDFLYPKEVKLALAPADTEYIAETAKNVDSVSTANAQIADTEYIAETAKNVDSVSTANAQIADTEYTVQVAENIDKEHKQNSVGQR
jgi:hypothetical protein